MEQTVSRKKGNLHTKSPNSSSPRKQQARPPLTWSRQKLLPQIKVLKISKLNKRLNITKFIVVQDRRNQTWR